VQEYAKSRGVGARSLVRQVCADDGVSPTESFKRHNRGHAVPPGLRPSFQGPLAILTKVWPGDRKVSPSISGPVGEYLQDPRDKMETTSQYAAEHSTEAKTSHVSKYNLRTRHEHFQVGNQAIV